MALPKTYVETSVISYLTSRPSRDQIALAHQQLTRDWWNRRRARFDLYVSELVLQEAARGDATAARGRLAAVAGYPVLLLNPEARALADTIMRSEQYFHRRQRQMRCTSRWRR